MMNEDVPDSTILLYVQRENRQLRREIEELKEGIKWRDLAIHDFKQWQKQVAEYNYLYWVRKGADLMENPPGEEERKRLLAVLESTNPLSEQIGKAKQALKALRKELKQLGKMSAELGEDNEE